MNRYQAKTERIGQWVRANRLRLGWTQAELAQRIQCNDAQISNYESGRFRPRMDRLIQMAQLFNTELPT